MKGLVFDIKRFALHDGPGIRTTVFFKGCPLRCWWCQNPESIREFPESVSVTSISSSYNRYCEEETTFGKYFSTGSLMEAILKDRIFFEESAGGVTFSGGEPLLQYRFLKEVLSECRKDNINSAIDTSGYVPFDAFDAVCEFTDLFLYDLKLIDDQLHRKFTDVSNQLILRNLERITESDNKVIIRVPLIPGITDTAENLSDIAGFLSSLKNIRQIDLLPYNKLAESKYRRFNKPSPLGNLETQSEEKLLEIKSFLETLNLKISLGG